METRQTIRERERLKKTIRDTIKKNIKVKDLDINMIVDRILWRKLIYVADCT